MRYLCRKMRGVRKKYHIRGGHQNEVPDERHLINVDSGSREENAVLPDRYLNEVPGNRHQKQGSRSDGKSEHLK